MAAGDDGQERTERATPKRLREAAERGQIPRSRELTTFAVLVAAAISLLALGPRLVSQLADLVTAGLSQDAREIHHSGQLLAVMGQALADVLELLVPFLLVMVVVALAAPLALGGWALSSKALAFKWERVDPLKGLKRLFSSRALMEFGKALGKFMVVAGVAVAVLWTAQPELVRLGAAPLLPALAQAARLVGWVFLVLTLPMILVAAVDVPFQLYDHARQLRMTLKEQKDEFKETEGRPEVKGRIRRLQQEFAQRRMMEKVPAADLILTNPTHFAVALKYDPVSMTAPIVVAKGVELVAANIRELARTHGVPLVESPLLARALYFNSDLEQPIPVRLYLAVAQVLAYVHQLRRESRLGAEPIVISDVPVPDDLRTE